MGPPSGVDVRLRAFILGTAALEVIFHRVDGFAIVDDHLKDPFAMFSLTLHMKAHPLDVELPFALGLHDRFDVHAVFVCGHDGAHLVDFGCGDGGFFVLAVEDFDVKIEQFLKRNRVDARCVLDPVMFVFAELLTRLVFGDVGVGLICGVFVIMTFMVMALMIMFMIMFMIMTSVTFVVVALMALVCAFMVVRVALITVLVFVAGVGFFVCLGWFCFILFACHERDAQRNHQQCGVFHGVSCQCPWCVFLGQIRTLSNGYILTRQAKP